MRLGRQGSSLLVLRASLFVLCASVAQACSSCSVPDRGDGATARGAYYGTAIFLTLLPVAVVLLLVRWVRREVLCGRPSAPQQP